MPIPVSCDCGRSFRVKDEAAGRKVRCPACASVVAVPRSEPARDVEDEALDFLLTEPSGDRPGTMPAALDRPEEKPTRPAPKPTAPPTPPRKLAAPPSRADSPRRPSREARRDSDGSRTPVAIHPSIILGCLMMLGAVVWFVVAFAAGTIYFYPPILFVLGALAVIRGFRGKE